MSSLDVSKFKPVVPVTSLDFLQDNIGTVLGGHTNARMSKRITGLVCKKSIETMLDVFVQPISRNLFSDPLRKLLGVR